MYRQKKIKTTSATPGLEPKPAACRDAQAILSELRSSPSASIDRPREYLLVPFNDPFVYDVTRTRDSLDFKRALRRLYAHGGGDAPEMCLTAIEHAVAEARRGSTIYVITDVEAKDYRKQVGGWFR